MDRYVAAVRCFHGPKVVVSVAPVSSLHGKAVVLTLQNDGKPGPESPRVIVRVECLLAGPAQDTVVPQGQSLLLRIDHGLEPLAAKRKVVVVGDQGAFEMLDVQVDMLAHGGRCNVPLRTRIAFAPYPDRPDVDPCDIGVAVVACRGGRIEVVQFLEKYGIVVVGFIACLLY